MTGGAGYIGSVLVPMLLDQDYQVTVIDSFMFKQTSLTDVIWRNNLRIVRGDVRDSELMKSEIAKHDVIIPLACLVGAKLCDQDPHAASSVNLDAIKNICSNVSKQQRIIFPCTNSGYGIGQKDIYCDEQSPFNPISFYGRLKVDAEHEVLQSGNNTTFRFATLFGIGPRMRLDLLVNDFVYRAVNDKALVLFESHFSRNFLHVRDAAAAFIHVINNHSSMKGNAYNVGLSSANINKEELCKIIQGIIPDFVYVKSEIGNDPDKRNYIVSNKKIEATGFAPKFSLEDGIKELIKGFSIIQAKEFRNS